MKIVLVGDFCEIDEVCTRAGHDIVHIVNSEEDEFYLGAGDKSTPLVIVPDGGSRRNIAMRYEKAGFRFATIVAKTADVSASATIGEGTVIAEHAIVTAKTHVGRFVKLNTAAKITHECEIGDYATIAPAAVILGRVVIGEGAYIGANATILPGLTIGKNAVVGAGAVVTKDMPDGETWVGIPARRLK